MRKISMEELAIIIENHKHYLYADGDGWENMRADLRGTDIRDADLKDTDLRYANLRYADLRYANLRSTDLKYANLRFTDLRYADLRFTDLKDTDLRYADLRCANLKFADLRGANLRGANLRYANLEGANLEGANLRCADLRDTSLKCANLEGANLWKADLRGAMNVPYIPMICPEEGSFIGYKIASDKIIKLCIPEDAKRSSATSRKCRCDRATVQAIYELDGSISNVTEVCSNYDSNFIYRIHKTVVVDDFDTDRWNECSTGIHFFMQRQEAIDYQG